MQRKSNSYKLPTGNSYLAIQFTLTACLDNPSAAALAKGREALFEGECKSEGRKNSMLGSNTIGQ